MRRAVVAAVVFVLALGLAGGPAAHAVDAPVDATSTTVAGDPGLGALDGGATTPSPRGQPAPPRSQRIADSAIALGLVVTLVGGVAVGLWTARRPSTVDDRGARPGK